MTETFGLLTVTAVVGGIATCVCQCGAAVKRKYGQLIQSKNQGIVSCCKKCQRKRRRGVRLEGARA